MPDIFVTPKKKESVKTASPLGEEKISLLSSFKLKPSGVSFQDQDEDEKIFLFLRAHFITNLVWIISSLALIIVPMFFFFIPVNTFPISLPSQYILVFLIFYYLAVFSYVLVSFITWFYNISLVTQKRVVDVDFSNVVYHDVAVTKLNLIEDVNFTQTGFVRSVFNFGDVFIQTAGEKNLFDFLAVPRPEKAVNIIQNLIGGDRSING